MRLVFGLCTAMCMMLSGDKNGWLLFVLCIVISSVKDSAYDTLQRVKKLEKMLPRKNRS